MFYEVRVFDSQGQLKKVISSKKLSNRFWRMNSNNPPEYDVMEPGAEEWSNRNGLKREKICVDESL